MKNASRERLKIRIDAAVRSLGNHLAYGRVDDSNVGMTNPFLGRSEGEPEDSRLTSREDTLKEAVGKGLKANSYSVYRQNLD